MSKKIKKYGQADVMCAVIHIFLEQQKKLTEDQKKKIEEKCYDDIKNKYPTAAEWELNI